MQMSFDYWLMVLFATVYSQTYSYLHSFESFTISRGWNTKVFFRIFSFGAPCRPEKLRWKTKKRNFCDFLRFSAILWDLIETGQRIDVIQIGGKLTPSLAFITSLGRGRDGVRRGVPCLHKMAESEVEGGRKGGKCRSSPSSSFCPWSLKEGGMGG